jgi:pimeloyl-ACP methyl ester carboxylesterase
LDGKHSLIRLAPDLRAALVIAHRAIFREAVMRRAAVLFLVLAVPAVGRADSCTSDFRVLGTQDRPEHQLHRVTTTVQIGPNPLNQFVVERVWPVGRSPRSLRPILLSPAWGLNNRSYTIGLQPGGADFENSVAANLARGGADVFLYSSRQALVAQDSCRLSPDGPGIDCSEMASWGLQSRLDDLCFIRNQIAGEHGPVKPVIGGVSLGGLAALAEVNQHPDAYAGLILIEATIAPLPVGRREAHLQFCATLQTLLDLGIVFDNASSAAGRALLDASLQHRDESSAVTGFTNRQLYLATLGSPSPGPPLSPYPAGIVVIATSVPEDRFLFASEDVTASQIYNTNFYNPVRELMDITCAMGGDPSFAKSFTDNLGAFTGPVLAFEAELGLGREVQSTLNLLGSRNVQVQFDPGFGHADLFYSADHANRLEGTILRWLEDTEGD